MSNEDSLVCRMINDIGLLPYSERQLALNLTTLAERRIRGDSIETNKIISEIVEYDVFHLSRSGSNIISKLRCDSQNVNKKLRRSFISERVLLFWNSLPVSVKIPLVFQCIQSQFRNFLERM